MNMIRWNAYYGQHWLGWVETKSEQLHEAEKAAFICFGQHMRGASLFRLAKQEPPKQRSH